MNKLARDYIRRAAIRLEVLEIYFNKKDFADVIREAQETVELALKGALRSVGIEAPRVHDVGRFLDKYRHLLPAEMRKHVDELRAISKLLRRERELSFYGAEDFVPLEEYSADEARDAIEKARFVVEVVKKSFNVETGDD